MTKDEMVKGLRYKAENIKAHMEPEFFAEIADYLEAQEGDAISREAALEAILTRVPDFCCDEGGNLVGRNETASYIRNLPPVTPKQKTGKILTSYEIGIDREGFERKFVRTRYCSLCKWDLGYNADILTHYCPNCGAKLENPE